MPDPPVRTPFLAANWKMHKGPTETRRFVRHFREVYRAREDRTVAFFPPAVSLPTLVEACEGRPDLEAGVQDVHQEREGAHTGAISASMAADAGARWGLAGHSERRREFGDGDDLVATKVVRLFESGLRPVLCVGETLDEREAGRLEDVLARQLGAVLDEVEPSRRGDLVYAYEPVWAIGTGRTAEPEDASEAHALLRRHLARLTDEETAADAVILYGGSVKPRNVEGLLAAEGVDGALVGGASLEAAAFSEICRAGGG